MLTSDIILLFAFIILAALHGKARENGRYKYFLLLFKI